MRNYILIICIVLLSSSSIFALKKEQKKTIAIIEAFVLNQNFDSAQVYLSKDIFSDSKDEYVNSLKAIAFNKSPSNKDYLNFVDEFTVKDYQKIDGLNIFINERVVAKNKKELDFDFFRIKWMQIMLLRNEAKMDLANSEYDILLNYVEQFDQDEKNVKRAQGYLLTHPIVLSQIEKDIETGHQLCEQMQKIAYEVKDTNLIIGSYYHVSDFYIEEQKLDEYIEVSEKAYQLDSLVKGHSYYYVGNLLHLINALIYKGGQTERVIKLLEELYINTDYRKHSYYLYLNLISQSKDDSEITDYIFKKFEVNNILELCESISAKAEGDMNPNEYFYLVDEIANSLHAHGFDSEALNYKNKEIHLIKEVYSQDLSKTLANFQSNQIRKEKQKELDFEKDKTQLFLISGLISLLFLVVALYAYIRKFKQAKILASKNIKIENQKNAIEKKDNEKALLLKEIHHRVKNNFQIVSSLLELQTKQIEDKDALGIVQEGQNRVKSMALIHQKLYQNDDLTVDFKDYLQKLIVEINNTYSSQKIENIINIDENYSLDIDTSIPLGLITNELITNSFKYAFNHEGRHSLTITFIKHQKEHQLIIKDNGPGLPKDYDILKSKSLGLRLVKNLSKQLHGRVEYSYNNGAEFSIFFKETHLRQLVD